MMRYPSCRNCPNCSGLRTADADMFRSMQFRYQSCATGPSCAVVCCRTSRSRIVPAIQARRSQNFAKSRFRRYLAAFFLSLPLKQQPYSETANKMCPPQSDGVMHANGSGDVDKSQFTKIDESADRAHVQAAPQQAAQRAGARAGNGQQQMGGFPRYADFLSNTSNFKVGERMFGRIAGL